MNDKYLLATLSRLFLFTMVSILIFGSDAKAQETNRRILFLSDHEGSMTLYTMQADGTDIQQFTDVIFEEGGVITDASLSPDGMILAVSSRKDRSDHPTNEIFLLDMATGDVTMLTNDGEENSMPIWSPDSQQLAYLGGGIYDLYETVNIFDITAETTDIIITGTDLDMALTPRNDSGMGIRGLDWSPDGSQLILTGQTPPPDGFSLMVVMNADGTNPRQVTPNELRVGSVVSWGSDPDLVYTACRTDNVGEICRLNLQTLHIDQLSNLSTVFPNEGNPYASSLDVSPSGEIIFTYGVTNHNIYQFNIADGSVNFISSVTGDNYELLGWVDIPSGGSSSCDTTISISDTTSLITAINTGNSAGVPYTICLENSTYTLNAVDNSNGLGANGLPVITGDITIIGNGATITRDVAAPTFRFFRVADGASLTLDGVTLSNGETSGDGGAIYNAGTLTVANVTLTGNIAAYEGGAIYNDYGDSLTVENSSFDGNLPDDINSPE